MMPEAELASKTGFEKEWLKTNVRKLKNLGLAVSHHPGYTLSPCGDGHFSLEVRKKRFGYLLNNHHGDRRLALNCKAVPGVNETLAGSVPDQFHIPKYIDHLG